MPHIGDTVDSWVKIIGGYLRSKGTFSKPAAMFVLSAGLPEKPINCVLYLSFIIDVRKHFVLVLVANMSQMLFESL